MPNLPSSTNKLGNSESEKRRLSERQQKSEMVRCFARSQNITLTSNVAPAPVGSASWKRAKDQEAATAAPSLGRTAVPPPASGGWRARQQAAQAAAQASGASPQPASPVASPAPTPAQAPAQAPAPSGPPRVVPAGGGWREKQAASMLMFIFCLVRAENLACRSRRCCSQWYCAGNKWYTNRREEGRRFPASQAGRLQTSRS